MSDDVQLIPVAKGDDYLEVHPTTLDAHKSLGWKECEKRDAPDAPEVKQTVALMRETLIAKGIAIPDGAKKADLQALLDAAA